MMSSLKSHRILVVLLAAFVFIGVLRLNDLSLYTDSVRYLIWGTSIGHCKGWTDDTQPVPEEYVVNAPLYPVLLAPALAVLPMSVPAAKVVTLFWGALGLGLFYVWLIPRIGRRGALLGTFVLAFNPMTIVLSSEMLSEAPYLAFVMGIFILLDRLPEKEDSIRTAPFLAVAVLGATIVLLREVAVTVVVAAALSMFLGGRRRQAMVLFGGAVALYGVWLVRNLVIVGTPETSQSTNLQFIFQHVVTPPDAPLAQELLSRAWLSARGFASQLGGMLFYSLPTTLIVEPGEAFKAVVNFVGSMKYVIFPGSVSAILFGLRLDLRQSRTALFRALIALFYMLIILTYPIHDFRFLFPILPLMVFYVLLSARWASERFLFHRSQRLLYIPAAIVIVGMIPNYLCLGEILRTNLAYVSDPVGFSARNPRATAFRKYFSEPWTMMGRWIRQNTPDSCTIVSPAKEISTFVGSRKVLEINDGVPLPTFGKLVRENDASYVLAAGLWEDVTSYEFVLGESREFAFEHVHSDADLHLYRIRSRFMTPTFERVGWTFRFDTTSAPGLLRKGRWELTREEYAQALRSLEKADRIAPGQPVILFQQLLVHAFTLDSAGTIRTLQTMFSSSRSTTYMWAARVHVTAMNDRLRARSLAAPQQRAPVEYEAARLYWDLGYARQATRLIQEVVRMDPTFFEGLLWAWYFSRSMGDSSATRSILESLKRIDGRNPVVVTFSAIQSMTDTLSRTSEPRKRALLRTRISGQFRKVDLPEEALDEAQRAIGEDPTCTDSRTEAAKLFESRGLVRQARTLLASPEPSIPTQR